MDRFVECAECDNLASRYESATLAVARVESALTIAERMYDVAAVERLTIEADRLVERLQEARAALASHQVAIHHIPPAHTIAISPRFTSVN